MCFLLYAGTAKPIPRRDWDENVPGPVVKSLTQAEAPIRAYFRSQEIQELGSTSGCGCEFPWLGLSGGGWQTPAESEIDAEWEALERLNQKILGGLLRTTGERIVELYGVSYGNFAHAPLGVEDVSLEGLMEPDFRFREECLYRVRLEE